MVIAIAMLLISYECKANSELSIKAYSSQMLTMRTLKL